MYAARNLGKHIFNLLLAEGFEKEIDIKGLNGLTSLVFAALAMRQW